MAPMISGGRKMATKNKICWNSILAFNFHLHVDFAESMKQVVYPDVV